MVVSTFPLCESEAALNPLPLCLFKAAELLIKKVSCFLHGIICILFVFNVPMSKNLDLVFTD